VPCAHGRIASRVFRLHRARPPLASRHHSDGIVVWSRSRSSQACERPRSGCFVEREGPPLAFAADETPSPPYALNPSLGFVGVNRPGNLGDSELERSPDTVYLQTPIRSPVVRGGVGRANLLVESGPVRASPTGFPRTFPRPRTARGHQREFVRARLPRRGRGATSRRTPRAGACTFSEWAP
jgi:hypothetical protein